MDVAHFEPRASIEDDVSLLVRCQQHGVPLTNCAGVWSCAFENWGIMQGSLKIEARAWDPSWHCFDVGADPHERVGLRTPACETLAQLAMAKFGRLPGGEKK